MVLIVKDSDEWLQGFWSTEFDHVKVISKAYMINDHAWHRKAFKKNKKYIYTRMLEFNLCV